MRRDGTEYVFRLTRIVFWLLTPTGGGFDRVRQGEHALGVLQEFALPPANLVRMQLVPATQLRHGFLLTQRRERHLRLEHRGE